MRGFLIGIGLLCASFGAAAAEGSPAGGAAVNLKSTSAVNEAPAPGIQLPAPSVQTVPAAEPQSAYPWRLSSFLIHNSISNRTFVRSADLTYAPYYDVWIKLAPRWYFNDQVSVRLKLDVDTELTDTVNTESVKKRQPLLGDIWVDFVYAKLYREPYTGITFSPNFRFYVPTSLESQARTLYLGVGPGFGLLKELKLRDSEAALFSKLEFTYGFKWVKNFNRYTTAAFDANYLVRLAENPESGVALSERAQNLDNTGKRNVSMQFINAVGVSATVLPKLKAGVDVIFINSLAYGLTPVSVESLGVQGGAGLLPESATNTNHRAAIWYLAEVSYEVLPWLGASVGFSTFGPQLTESSTYRPVFFNRYTNITGALEVTFDPLVDAIKGKAKWF